MRKHLLATTLALSIAAALPGTGLIPSAHAQAAPPASMVSPNRYGLPDFGDLVEQVGPAVVNISVVQRAAQRGWLSPGRARFAPIHPALPGRRR